MAKSGIICLVGLPGSGKSFAVEQIKQQYSESDIHIVVFDYDGLIGVVESDDEKAWKHARNDVSRMICGLFSEDKCAHCSRCTEHNSAPHILILDDNFFYSSMRKEVYHMCQKFGCVFGEIVFDFGAEVCKSRNKERNKEYKDVEAKTLVSEETIENMVKLFELPNESWERNVLWFSDKFITDNTAHVPAHINPVLVSPDSDKSDHIATFLLKFLDLDPEKDPAAVQVLKAEDRAKTLSDLKHQGDVCLRKISSEKIKSDRKSGIKCPYSVYAGVKDKVIGRFMEEGQGDTFIIKGVVDKSLLHSYLLDNFNQEFLNVS